MQNFVYRNPVKVLFGRGQIAAIAREIPEGAKVLLTYGGGSIFRNGVHAQVRAALEGRTVLEFGGIEPNPRYETLMRAVEVCRERSVDFLLAVGGGSVLDGTKFVALAARHEGDPWDLVTRAARPKEALPLGAVLTLPATGSEMNAYAVVTREATREKRSFGSDLVYPRFSVLDPETTFSLPPRQIANGVVDAFTHTLEQYLTYPAQAPLQDRFAEGILLTLVEEGPKTLADPMDYGARAHWMRCAAQALNGLIGCGVPQDWATHAIGHEPTALHGLDHAQTLAVVLPSLLTVMEGPKREKLLQYGDRVWGLREASEDARIAGAIAATRAFFEGMGNPTRLSAYGVDGSSFPEILGRLEARPDFPLGEGRGVGASEVDAILRGAL